MGKPAIFAGAAWPGHRCRSNGAGSSHAGSSPEASDIRCPANSAQLTGINVTQKAISLRSVPWP